MSNKKGNWKELYLQNSKLRPGKNQTCSKYLQKTSLLLWIGFRYINKIVGDYITLPYTQSKTNRTLTETERHSVMFPEPMKIKYRK